MSLKHQQKYLNLLLELIFFYLFIYCLTFSNGVGYSEGLILRNACF